MTSRYCFCPMTAKRIGRRVTLIDMLRKRRALKRMAKPDLFPVTGFYEPVYPRK